MISSEVKTPFYYKQILGLVNQYCLTYVLGNNFSHHFSFSFFLFIRFSRFFSGFPFLLAFFWWLKRNYQKNTNIHYHIFYHYRRSTIRSVFNIWKERLYVLADRMQNLDIHVFLIYFLLLTIINKKVFFSSLFSHFLLLYVCVWVIVDFLVEERRRKLLWVAKSIRANWW